MVSLNSTLGAGDARIEGYLTEWHPLLIFVFGAVVAVFLTLLIIALRRLNRTHQDQQVIEQMRTEFDTERMRSEAVLQNIDIGLLAYTPDGRLALANEAAATLLHQNPPASFSDLLDAFPTLADVRAQLVLGAKATQTMIDVPGRKVQLRFREAAPNGQRLATIVVMRDVTGEEREQKQRREFVANVSHELKTPITTIRSYTESLIDWGLSEKSQDQVRGDLVRINDDAMRMDRLVSDLLLLSALDSEGQRMHMEEIDLKLLLRQIMERFRMQASKEQIDLGSDEIDPRIPPVFADYNSIERILSNLVSNALKYTDAGGTIRLSLRRQGDEVCVSVRDDGRGIPAAQVPFIFDRFYRVDSTGSRKLGGTGLGLSIAKELVALHHGKLDVRSIQGEGSTFTMRLPIAYSIYRKVWDQMQRTGRMDTDPLMQAAGVELTKLARDFGVVDEDVDAVDLGQLNEHDMNVIWEHLDVET